jgi:hypothetical protein
MDEESTGILMAAVVNFVERRRLAYPNSDTPTIAQLSNYGMLNCLLAVATVTKSESITPPVDVTELGVVSMTSWLAARMMEESMLLEGLAICSLKDGGSNTPLLRIHGADTNVSPTVRNVGDFAGAVWNSVPPERLRARILHQFGGNPLYSVALARVKRIALGIENKP